MRAPSLVSGREATKSSKVGATGSARKRATHSTQRAKARRMSLSIDRDKLQAADKPTLYKQIRLDIERRS